MVVTEWLPATYSLSCADLHLEAVSVSDEYRVLFRLHSLMSKTIPLFFIWTCVAAFVVASIISVESYFAMAPLIAFSLFIGLVLSRERSVSVSIRSRELRIATRLFVNFICWKRVFNLADDSDFIIAKAKNENRDRVWDVFFQMSVDQRIFLFRLEENEMECGERFRESLNRITFSLKEQN